MMALASKRHRTSHFVESPTFLIWCVALLLLLTRSHQGDVLPTAQAFQSSSLFPSRQNNDSKLNRLMQSQQKRRQRQQHAQHDDAASATAANPVHAEDTAVASIEPVLQGNPSESAETWKPRPTSYDDGDSVDRFHDDVTKVLKSVYGHDEDLTIPLLYRARNPSFTSVWTNEDWKMHTSRRRLLRHLKEFPTSRLLRRCAPQLSVLAVWTVSVLRMMDQRSGSLKLVDISLGPLGLVSSFLALLLTLRSNQGLTRLTQAREAFSKSMMVTREIAQIIATSVIPRDEQLGLLAARHTSIFGWCLKKHIRGTWNTTEDVASIMLPQFRDAHFVTDYTRKQPAAILLRLRQIVEEICHPSHPKGPLPNEVQQEFARCLLRLQETIAAAESIRSNPVPPLYTTHTTRLLVFYLFSLPLAIHRTIQHSLTAFIVTMAVGFTMFGLDEISHLLENPFGLMPLYQVSKAIMMDVADVIVLPLPSLYADDLASHAFSGSGSSVDSGLGIEGTAPETGKQEYDFSKPSYW